MKNAVSVELKDVTFKTSVKVNLYSGDTLLTTATLQGVKPGSYDFLTCCIATETADANWALTPWTPKDDVVPDKAVLVVDGHELDEETFTLNADEWAALPGTVFPYSGSIERAGITHDNGILKNAVSVDLKNVTFKTSVQVKLYSGDTLLTTATLQGVNPGSHGFLTCCIATETADANWALTPWTPKDDVVPNKAVLFVDGHEQDTKTFTLDADEWAALPGTVLPYSGSGGGGGSSHSSRYTITVDSVKHGTITVSPKSAYKGDTVTITVKPDKGYELDTLKVLDKDGDKVKITEKKGKYTFTMPASKVTVKGKFVEEAPEQIFADVPVDAYCYEAVKWAASEGITGGIGNNLFAPGLPCTRGQIVTFLWRAEKSPAVGTANPFTDVEADAYYAGATNWAVENGITEGTGDGTTFSPANDCTRAQIVTFLYRYFVK